MTKKSEATKGTKKTNGKVVPMNSKQIGAKKVNEPIEATAEEVYGLDTTKGSEVTSKQVVEMLTDTNKYQTAGVRIIYSDNTYLTIATEAVKQLAVKVENADEFPERDGAVRGLVLYVDHIVNGQTKAELPNETKETDMEQALVRPDATGLQLIMHNLKTDELEAYDMVAYKQASPDKVLIEDQDGYHWFSGTYAHRNMNMAMAKNEYGDLLYVFKGTYLDSNNVMDVLLETNFDLPEGDEKEVNFSEIRPFNESI